MGRSVTPTYRVEVQANTRMDMFSWDCKVNGRATETNLENWRQAYNASFGPGGVNWHVSEASGVVVHISKARLIRQRTGEVVAETNAPLFEVV